MEDLSTVVVGVILVSLSLSLLFYMALAGTAGDVLLLRWQGRQGLLGFFTRTLNAADHKVAEGWLNSKAGRYTRTLFVVTLPGLVIVFAGFLLPAFVVKLPFTLARKWASSRY